jgi:hypothetical protein
MNRWIVICVIALTLLGAIAFVRMQPSSIQSNSVTPTGKGNYCTSDELEALIALSPAAGNVYGTLTLKNVSSAECEVLGGKFVTADYDSSIKNIAVTHIGQTQEKPFILSPGQTIYSQVHYPNGPQCQSVGLNQTRVTFSYQVSPTDAVSFKNSQGGTQQIVQSCLSPDDMTEIQIWNMANQPITP